MLRRLGWVFVIVALSHLVADAAAPPRWTQVRFSNFLFISDASESRLRSTVRKLEEFLEVLVRATPRFTTTSPVPTIVFVFADHHGLRPYHPRFDGGIKNVDGYFQPGDDVNYIAMAANSGTALQIVFHEFTHFLIDNTEGETPPWFAEGLAQLYQTLTIDNDRRTAVLGAAPPGHVQLLKKTPLIPLERLMGVEEAWAAFHAEPRGRETFYAQSWALAHYLVVGSQARRGQLDEYLRRTQSGDPFDQAFSIAFRSDPRTLEQELGTYVLQSSPPRSRIPLGDKATVGGAQRGQSIDDAEVQAYLGDLLSRIGREDEGRRLLKSLLDANQDNAHAAAALGSMELRDSRPDLALPLVERAAALRPDDGAIQMALGIALYDQAQRLWDRFTPPDAFERARAVLARAAALDAAVAPSHVALGYAQLATGDLDRAAESMGRAIQLAPARKDYRLALARVFLRQRDYVRADAELQPLVARARPEVRDAARAMLEVVANERRLGASTGPARPPTRGFVAGPPAFRLRRDGEEGVAGRFTQVDCGGAVPLYHFQTERGSLRLTETAGGVQLIAYRSDAPRAVGCGPVPDAPFVFVTYRPAGPDGKSGSTSPSATDVHGTAVAIEFVPDGFIRP